MKCPYKNFLMQSNHDNKINLPAEWEQQSGILITWPHAYSDWKDKLFEIETTYLAICKAVMPYQKVLIICYDQTHHAHIEKTLTANAINNDACILAICKSNDTWCRDYGPISTCCDGSVQLNNFIFNGWGEKYDAELDNSVSRSLNNKGIFNSTPLIDREFLLEGGSIDTDGQGTLLTTSHCLLKRHSDKDKADIENYFNKYLGINTIHWLDHGALGGDDTDSHIDNLARFVNKETIVYCACDNKEHPDYDSLHKMETQLKLLRQKNGNKYKLIPIYIPVLIEDKGKALPASYINFLIVNQAILVPTFDVPEDNAAIEIFKQCYPNRSIIAIDSNALIKQFGGLHCATMNFPTGVLQ